MMFVYHFRRLNGYDSYLLQHKEKFKKEELEAVILEAEEAIHAHAMLGVEVEDYLLEHEGFEKFQYYALIDMDYDEICINEETEEGDET